MLLEEIRKEVRFSVKGAKDPNKSDGIAPAEKNDGVDIEVEGGDSKKAMDLLRGDVSKGEIERQSFEIEINKQGAPIIKDETKIEHIKTESSCAEDEEENKSDTTDKKCDCEDKECDCEDKQKKKKKIKESTNRVKHLAGV